MKHIRALIVEDEPIARAALRCLAEEEEDIAIVGECPDGVTALTAIRRHRPELVFLDVQLPGMNGLDLLKALDGDVPPAVIFVTAHARYALPAFASHATDFRLKPFTPERFRESLKRARLRLRDKAPIESSGEALTKSAKPRSAPPSVLTLKVGKRFVLIRADAIEAIVANESSCVLYTTEGNHRTRLRMRKNERSFRRNGARSAPIPKSSCGLGMSRASRTTRARAGAGCSRASRALCRIWAITSGKT